MRHFANDTPPPCGTVQMSFWVPGLGETSMWGKEFWISSLSHLRKDHLISAVICDMVWRLNHNKNVFLDTHLKRLLDVFVQESINFWWDTDCIHKADIRCNCYNIKFYTLPHLRKKEVHIQDKDKVLLDMYTYYGEPYVEEDDTIGGCA